MEVWITYFSIFSPLLAIIAFHINGGEKFLSQKLLALFIVYSFVIDLYFGFIHKGPNHYLLKIYGLTEFGWISFILLIILKPYKLHLTFVFTIYLLYYVASSFFIQNEDTFNSIGRAVECLIFIGASLLIYYKLYVSEREIFIENDLQFWIATALLLYFSGALFSFLLGSKIFQNDQYTLEGSWIFHNIANILKNILFAIGLWKVRVVT